MSVIKEFCALHEELLGAVAEENGILFIPNENEGETDEMAIERVIAEMKEVAEGLKEVGDEATISGPYTLGMDSMVEDDDFLDDEEF